MTSNFKIMWPFSIPKLIQNPLDSDIHIAKGTVVTDEDTDEPMTVTARKSNINLLYHFDKENPRAGGYTIAYRPCISYTGRKHGKMVDVAVSYCAEGDVFSKKIGREKAITNFWNGHTICVPALAYGEDELHNCLREMFSWDLGF